MLGHGMRLQLLTERQTDAERERERDRFLLYRFCHIPTEPLGMDRAGRLLVTRGVYPKKRNCPGLI